MTPEQVRLSKFLSLVLRHRPEEIGLTLDAQGWADVAELIERVRQTGRPIDRGQLEQVVAGNDKQRFAFSAGGARIRASQGHSVAVDLDLPPRTPPERLYHGTATRFLESIRAGGLHSGKRRHVHLSPDHATARRVGQRHGRPVVLGVRALAMHAAGHVFFLSANGVWLTETVPALYLEIPEDA